MDTKIDQHTFAKEEWELVIELIEREAKELYAEIDKTDFYDYRVKLSRRIEVTHRLLSILRPMTAV